MDGRMEGWKDRRREKGIQELMSVEGAHKQRCSVRCASSSPTRSLSTRLCFVFLQSAQIKEPGSPLADKSPHPPKSHLADAAITTAPATLPLLSEVTLGGPLLSQTDIGNA